MSYEHELNELLLSSTSSAQAPPTEFSISHPTKQISTQSQALPTSPAIKPKHSILKHYNVRWRNVTDRYWIYELISCLLALSALASIVGVLARFDGRSIPHWPNLISINTMIAILTAILKVSLLLPVTEGISELKWLWFEKSRPLSDISVYDSASRGPWGSFLFLVSRKPHSVASLGALITIFALAIDPFSQQVIKYQNCLQLTTTGTSRIVRSNNYSTAGIHEGAGEASLDGPMMIGIYNGLLNPAPNASSLISIQCSSGNCTFPSDNGASYTSLAMCHDVQDISQYIQNLTGVDGYSFPVYTLPSGPELHEGTMLSSTVTHYNYNATPAETLPQNMTNALFIFEALMYTCNLSSTAGCPSPFAIRASIYPCVETYGGNITKSMLTETTLSSIPLTWNSRSVLTLVTNTTIRNGSFSDCKAEDGAQTSTYSVPVYGDIPLTPNYTYSNAPDSAFLTTSLPNNTVEWYAPDCTYSLNLGPVEGISEFLHGFFGNNNLTSPYGQYNNVGGDLWLMNLYLNGTANMATANGFMQGLADSMTAVIRANGDPASPGYANYASGVVYENQTCIHVRWGWLVLPAAVLLAGIGFLVATIILTSTHRLSSTDNSGTETHGHFKSSPLALLLHGIEPRTLQTLQQPRDVAGMEALAEKLNVSRLRRATSGSTYFAADH